jgi:hypothetical protein
MAPLTVHNPLLLEMTTNVDTYFVHALCKASKINAQWEHCVYMSPCFWPASAERISINFGFGGDFPVQILG